MNLRRATWADAAYLLRLRNEGEQASWYEGTQTTCPEHEAWLAARLNNPAVRIWVIREGDIPVGVIRLDSNDEISVQIEDQFRGCGYGVAAIQAACQHATGRVKACVDHSNKEAAAAFEKAGFVRRPDVDFYLWKP